MPVSHYYKTKHRLLTFNWEHKAINYIQLFLTNTLPKKTNFQKDLHLSILILDSQSSFGMQI